MYLKRLELQGYKSFARKTEFVFERGITAIVGPNGSGKSNIADSVRWVLGETRMSQLRAKVTDDLIFAGSDRRARVGMAQVCMILDNCDGTLPIDYTEVSIERRAYRDGQNEYLINGTKVRLRDIVELLGAGGLTRDAYTVIGQGLVDTALSLRSQERRALIDVAAGIRPLQDKRDRALAQLDETHNNLTRVRDIAAEIEPRLRYLEKQAERARQGAQIAHELAEALKVWYGYQWHAGQQALQDARTRAAAARETLAQRRQDVATLEQRIESHREREETQADARGELRARRADLREDYETVRRDLAVRQERLKFLQRRQQELAQEIADLRTQRDEQQHQLQETETKLAQLHEQCDQLAARVSTLRQQHAGVEQRKIGYRSALDRARKRALELATTLAEIRNWLATLADRREELAHEQAAQQDAMTGLTAQLERHQATLADACRQVEEHAQTLQQLTRDRETCLASLDTATASLEALGKKLADARRHLERLQARREALAEMHKAATGAGAQALLNAREELGGIVGSLASLIRVPAELETAIEAALGPHLHAVVVETWADAQRAIAWLRANEAGRATLLVLVAASAALETTEVVTTGLSERYLEETEEQGSIGIASELVDCDPQYRPLVERLLGQIVVVESLATVRQVPPSSPSVPLSSAWLVTRDGTAVHPSGQITGGTPAAPVLRLERLWWELPAQIGIAEAEVARRESEQAGTQTMVDELTRRLAQIDAGLRRTQTAQAEAQVAVEQARRDIEVVERELDWRRGIVDRRSEELKAIQAEMAKLLTGNLTPVEEIPHAGEDQREIAGQQGRLEQMQVLYAEAQHRVESLQAQLSQVEAEALRDELAEVEKQLAVAQRDRQNQQARQADLQATLASLDRQIEAKRGQIDALAAETDELQARIEALAGDERRLAQELDALEAEVASAEEALRIMRREGRELEREVARVRDLLHQAEAVASEASLNVQRQEDRLTALRDKIADDLELAAVGEELPRQLMLALEGETEVLPVVAEIPEGLERRVQQLRRQLRALGSTSPEIIAEYEETRARYDFLTSQAADLEKAAADLRVVAAELTEVMRERFSTTFEEVSGAFEKYFKQLFGGGEAHMSLVEDDEGEPGLEIVARPPGKRSQSLALLSGGERALTAVALLFALLRASPTPFCILDEVDATLDEANIGRFRSALEDLAEEMQFIIITHNRGTIQAADTIYGISMSDDGVSQVISLKLDELEPVAA